MLFLIEMHRRPDSLKPAAHRQDGVTRFTCVALCVYLMLAPLLCQSTEVGATVQRTDAPTFTRSRSQAVNKCTACFQVSASMSCRVTREAYCRCNHVFKECFDRQDAGMQLLPTDSAYGAYAGKTCAAAFLEDEEANCNNLPCDECYVRLAACAHVATEKGEATSLRGALCRCNEQFKACYASAGAKALRITSSISQRDMTCEALYKEDDRSLSCPHGLEWHWILLIVVGLVLLLSACAQATRRLVQKQRRARMSDVGTLPTSVELPLAG